MKLSETFRAYAPAAAIRAVAQRELEDALQDLIARGSRAWPELGVKPEELVRYAARHLRFSGDSPSAKAVISALHAEDMHLACACSLNISGALEAFDRTLLGSHLAKVLSRFAPSAAFVDEVRQGLREKLFVRKGDEPGIAKYSGRGPLAHWIQVTALRTALNLRRRRSTPSALKHEPELASVSPDLRYLKHRYGKEFQKAISAAFSSLDDKQCNLLRLQYVDGLRTAQIAALFHVDRSTVKRQLAACRAQLLDETQHILRDRLGISPSELESLGALVQSQLQLSMERLLRRRPSVRDRPAGDT